MTAASACAGALTETRGDVTVVRVRRTTAFGASQPIFVPTSSTSDNLGSALATDECMSIDDLWHRNAIIYCLDVEKFQDASGDGVGDFQGLRDRLPYLAGLGVTCIWILPFSVSPNRDNGYDISDYYSVDSRHGSLGDF